jgi:cytochrome c553
MLLRISLVLALFWTHAAIAQQPAPAGDAKAAHKKVQMCEGCHGIAGYRTAYPDVYSVPKLGGQQPTYLVRAMQAYKSGERTHPSMRGIAAGLSDQDMADIAAYYGAAK